MALRESMDRLFDVLEDARVMGGGKVSSTILKPDWKMIKFGDFVECVREQGQPN